MENRYNPTNGRINLPGADNVARTVSPRVDSFYANIEVGIMPVVKALIERDYLTVSSCGGHFYEGDNREVTLAFPDICHRAAFWEQVWTNYSLKPQFREQFFNVGNPSKAQEIRDCNALFGTNHPDFVFLTLWILPTCDDDYNKALWERSRDEYADAVCKATLEFVRLLESITFPTFQQLLS